MAPADQSIQSVPVCPESLDHPCRLSAQWLRLNQSIPEFLADQLNQLARLDQLRQLVQLPLSRQCLPYHPLTLEGLLNQSVLEFLVSLSVQSRRYHPYRPLILEAQSNQLIPVFPEIQWLQYRPYLLSDLADLSNQPILEFLGALDHP